MQAMKKGMVIYMKKYLLFIISTLILSQFFVGCSRKEIVPFKPFYNQVLGFSNSGEEYKPIEQDTLLMLDNEDFQDFKKEYFEPREIPMEEPDEEKAVLYLQIPSESSSVNTYSVKDVSVKGNILTVNLINIGVAKVNPVEGFDGKWYYVILLGIDKTNLKENLKIA